MACASDNSEIIMEEKTDNKRKNTSFKITNILPSRPPSHDPEESGDEDPDDSHTEDISEHFEHVYNNNVSNVTARGRFNILPCPQDELAGQTAQQAGQTANPAVPSAVAPPVSRAAPIAAVYPTAGAGHVTAGGHVYSAVVPVQAVQQAVIGQQVMAGNLNSNSAAPGIQQTGQAGQLQLSSNVGVSASPGSLANTTITATAGVTAQLPNANR